MFRTELGILAHQVGADEGFGRRRGGGLKAWLQWLGNHLGGEQLAEFDSEFLRAGDPELPGARPLSADSGSPRPSLVRTTSGKPV
jgi:hypothetical protein